MKIPTKRWDTKMKVFMIIYKNKDTKKEGFILAKGRDFSEVNNKIKQKYNNKLDLVEVITCDNINKSNNFQVFYKYEDIR